MVKPHEHVKLAEEVQTLADTSDQSFVQWAARHIAGENKGNPIAKLTFDLSSFSPDEQAGIGILVQRLIIDGPQEDKKWHKNADTTLSERFYRVWSASEHRYRVVRCFHKLIETMVDTIDWCDDAKDERLRKGATVFANCLSGFVHRIQKRLEDRPFEKDKDEEENRLWQSEIFQKMLGELRKHKTSAHPKRRFVEYVCMWPIGYNYANARLNERDLIIDGIVWKWPKTGADFNEMRPILQSVSVDYLDHYAEILDEDGLTGQAQKVRSLTKSKDRHSYYHKAQFDESFRSYFGLSTPRKSKAKRASKGPKKRARSRG